MNVPTDHEFRSATIDDRQQFAAAKVLDLGKVSVLIAEGHNPHRVIQTHEPGRPDERNPSARAARRSCSTVSLALRCNDDAFDECPIHVDGTVFKQERLSLSPERESLIAVAGQGAFQAAHEISFPMLQDDIDVLRGARARSRRRSSSATPPFTMNRGFPPSAARSSTPAMIMYETQARTRPSLTPTSRAYACAYLVSTPADGGGPVGGLRVGVARHHRESTWCGDSDDGVSSRAALVRAARPHRA